MLNDVLKGGLAGGRWAIFCDLHRQAIYANTSAESMLALIEEYAPRHVRYTLTINCRNTRPIIEETAAMSGFDTPPCLPSNVDGPAVEYTFYRDTAHQQTLALEYIHRLMKEGFSPEQITVLARVRRENSCLATLSDSLPYRIENLSEETTRHRKDAIGFSTIHSFKGLENAAIILTDIERLVGENEAALLYTGMSRARHRLILLVSQAARKDYETMVRQKMAKEAGGA